MKEITSQELIDRVLMANDMELNEVMDAVTERFAELWEDWELLIISLPGHSPDGHIKVLERIIATYEHIKQSEPKLTPLERKK